MQPAEDLLFFETSGFSMWPFLRGGEKLIIKKIPADDLKIGDIILYRTNNQLVCHRLVKKIKDRYRYLFYVRGDNSNSPAELVRQEMFQGKVVGVVKNGKVISLTNWRTRIVSRLIIIIAPLINAAVRIIKRI